MRRWPLHHHFVLVSLVHLVKGRFLLHLGAALARVPVLRGGILARVSLPLALCLIERSESWLGLLVRASSAMVFLDPHRLQLLAPEVQVRVLSRHVEVIFGVGGIRLLLIAFIFILALYFLLVELREVLLRRSDPRSCCTAGHG
jgi:hypothetical protein